MLSKYHAIFLPAGALLYILAEPSSRRVLRKPGPYLPRRRPGGVLAVIAWNASHGWASFAFQGGRRWPGSMSGSTRCAARSRAGRYLFPWIWLTLVIMLVRHLADSTGGLALGAVPDLPVGRAPGRVHGGGLPPAGPPALDPGGLSLALPLLGRSWEARYRIKSHRDEAAAGDRGGGPVSPRRSW